MRTTLTLDDDLAMALQEIARATGRPFKSVVNACLRKGLLMFAPVGLGGGCIKIAPPLITPRDALEEGLGVLEEACAEVLG